MFVPICRRAILRLAAAVLVATSVPCAAYLIDSGSPQHLGVSIKDGTSCVWAAEPFALSSDAYVTSLGGALARALGPAGSGFEVYISATRFGLPGSAIAQLPSPLVPLSSQYVYYYGSFASPVRLSAGLYYLVFMPTSSEFYGSISWAVKPGIYYGQGTADYGQSWYALSFPLAIRVDGYYAPEPSSLVVILSGLCGGLAVYRKKVEG